MFELGPPTPETVDAAAQVAGLDLAQARRFAQSEAVTRELAQNMGLPLVTKAGKCIAVIVILCDCVSASQSLSLSVTV
jgi:hypothetical protein